MKHKTYAVKLTGQTPLLLHHDNLDHAEKMKLWEKDPRNRSTSTKGDDRSPAWRWIGCLYEDIGALVIPADNLMTVLREGGKRCPTGKGMATFKSQTQSGIVINEIAWPIIVAKDPIASESLDSIRQETDFEKHQSAVTSLGFSLFVKRAKIGAAKHIRVRPRFDTWSVAGTLTVFDEMITEQVLQDILTFAGRYAGLGDWRPSSPKSPGSFGTFTSEIIPQ